MAKYEYKTPFSKVYRAIAEAGQSNVLSLHSEVLAVGVLQGWPL